MTVTSFPASPSCSLHFRFQDGIRLTANTPDFKEVDLPWNQHASDDAWGNLLRCKHLKGNFARTPELVAVFG